MQQAKRLFSLLLALALVLACAPHIPLKAAAATDGYYTYTVTNGEATITDVSIGISGDITIPSTLGGYPVTTIGSDAFYYCSKLASVTIPDSITTIGDYAFQDCIKLKNIFFDGKAPNIVGRAFSNVTATAYYYPDETWTTDVLQDYSGYITWVALEKACEIIAFGICGANVTWTLDEEGTLTISGSGPMYNCETANDVPWAGHRNDIKKVIIGDSVTTIGSFMFSYCSRLTSIDIPNSVATIGSNAFKECTELSCLVIPASVKLIDYYAFYNCICLDEIYFEGSAPSIGVDAFYNTEPVSVTAYYYPDETWTEDVMQDYGGNITWVALGSTVLCGDFTGDGYITDEDVIYLLWYTVFPEDYPLNQSGDIDGDSFVTDADVIYLLWHTVFPEDYPLKK